MQTHNSIDQSHFHQIIQSEFKPTGSNKLPALIKTFGPLKIK